MSSYCPPCKRHFGSYNALTSHLANSGRHAYCSMCQEEFDSRDELWEHEEDYHPECDDCQERFRNDYGLREHFRQSHGDRYCVPCNRLFQHSNNLIGHLNSSIHKPKNFKCPMRGCTQAFVSPSACVLHLEAGTCASGITRQLINRYILQKDVNNVITNPARMITSSLYAEPPTYIASARSWNAHMQQYQCCLCSNGFNTLPSLNAHLASPKHTSPIDKIYRCPKAGGCGQFTTLSGLVQHIERGSCGIRSARGVNSTIEGLMGGMGRLTL